MLRKDLEYKIISNERLQGEYFEMKFLAPAIAKNCKPGQFFMIDIPGVFLRRPISVHNAEGNIVSLLYKVVGKGTDILSSMKSEIKVLGSLGRGYALKENISPIIVAGGTGIASLYFLARSLKNKGVLYYGAKSKKDLLCIDKFKKEGWKIFIATEDGSKGHKGFITEIINDKIKAGGKEFLYVCGPAPMIKAVSKIVKEKGLQGQASLEEKMGCGFGNCQGCAVKILGKNKTVCKDGPVFNIEDIEI